VPYGLTTAELAGAGSVHVELVPREAHSGKRSSDVVLACVLLVLLSPLMLLVALAVGMTSPGGVLFRQTRIGRDGVPFTMLKFRTMFLHGPERHLELLGLNEGSGLLFKIRRDPRVSRVGRVLRRYSLDELPQLLNVVGGQMSLVGPRPALPGEVLGYAEHERRRLHVKPGLTGLWQVSGRSDLTWEQSVHLDLHYVRHASLRLDLSILLRTVSAVVRGRGAY
jgi:lipopolysaccharide/colanic/teichoic acid biosynthesis glycosyltransferase